MTIPKATEADWYESVRELARTCNWEVFHVHDARRSAAGWPDVVLMRPPVVLFREMKLRGRRPTPSQRAWIDGLVACGADAKTWTFPDDWDEVVETLTRRPAP